ncbi:MAG: DUF2461 domain-containing protein [Cyclobacteriaceae bacterium]
MDLTIILTFLKSIAKNNNREWFEKNKPKYLIAKEGFEKFLEALHAELLKFDEALAGLNPKKLAFRIYRDVRFSKDKSPYKINMGAGFSPKGKMEQEPGYYVHIQPNNQSFVAGGMYMPDAANLAKIRQEIDYNSVGFNKILSDKKFKKTFPKGLDDFDKLKTAPKGYPKDHPQLELLKNKSFIVSHYFTDKEVADKKFAKKVAEVCKTLKPLNDFLTTAIAS